ncbi:MAG: hypothetical protein M3Z36_06015 [Acidobacteriota bacterium]|nr:hypothetical protein [Acidobacteriota bacterium]
MRHSLNAALLLSTLLCPIAAWSQKYTGPMPSKPDVPYLVHADTLVETESAEAKEQKAPKKEEITYIVPGANSAVKTPLASPILLFQTDKLSAEKLQMYKLEARNGNREITFSNKKKNTAKPVNISVNRVAEGLYRIEVTDSLPNGEYALTPEGSNQVFCFAID